MVTGEAITAVVRREDLARLLVVGSRFWSRTELLTCDVAWHVKWCRLQGAVLVTVHFHFAAHVTSALAVTTREFTEYTTPHLSFSLALRYFSPSTFLQHTVLLLHHIIFLLDDTLVPLHAFACTKSFTLYPPPLLTRDNISNSTMASASILRAESSSC